LEVAARGRLIVLRLIDLEPLPEVLAAAQRAAAAFVDGELGVNEVAMILHQPVDTVEGAAFFVGREREDQIAIGREPFLFKRIRFAISRAR
jgi:hypothetical protein